VLERLWLRATALGLGVHVISATTYLFGVLDGLVNEGVREEDVRRLEALFTRYREILPLSKGETEIAFIRFVKAPQPAVRALRRPLSKVLCFED
jgi:hypothetical protein